MKIREFFLALSVGLQSFLKRWGKLILTFLLTVFGFYIAFIAFQYLNLRGFQSRSKPGKDTVYVKLVNGNISSYSSTRLDTSTINNTPGTIPGLIRSSEQPVPGPVSYLRVIPPAKPITPGARRDATGLALLSMHVFPWWSVLMAALFTLGSICYIFYYSLPYYSMEMNKDMDPDALAELFKKFGDQIESIGNPRKIKRLSNKIRFQYHYLVYKNLASGPNLDQLVKTLLLFESPNVQGTVLSDDTKKFTEDQKSFTAYLVKNGIRVNNEKLVRILYALNRDSFY